MQNSSHARLDVLQGSLTPNCVSFYVDEKKKEKEKKRKKLFYLYCTNSTRLRVEVSLSLSRTGRKWEVFILFILL
jgi:hypothetical protein